MMDAAGGANHMFLGPPTQESNLNNAYSHIGSNSILNNPIATATQDSRQQTVKTQQMRCQDAHSNFSNGVIYNTMNNQSVPSQRRNRELQIQRDELQYSSNSVNQAEHSRSSHKMLHRKLQTVEPSSTNMSGQRSSKSVGSAGVYDPRKGRNSIQYQRVHMSDNGGRSHQNTFSQNSRSNISDDRTTRRSISDIRQRYCQLKQKEMENEWRIQDAKDKIESKKSYKTSPKTENHNFEQITNSCREPCLQMINVHSGNSSNNGTVLTVLNQSANKVDLVKEKNSSNFNTMLNSQYIKAEDQQVLAEAKENRPFQRNGHIPSQEAQPYNGINVHSINETIKMQDLSNTVHEGTGKMDFLSGHRSLVPNASSSMTELQGYTEYYSVGAAAQGQLGRPHKGKDPNKCYQPSPKSLSFDILIQQITCGGSHVLLLSSSNELFSFGSNSHGQLGLNDKHFPFSTAPLLVQTVKRIQGRILQIKAGGKHNLMLIDSAHSENDPGHDLYSWGCNQNGECAQLIKQHPILYMPFKVYSKVIRHNRIASIDCGEGFSGFATVTGEAYTWGDNTSGQLGIGVDKQFFENVREPTKVRVDIPIKQISLGYKHSLFLSVDHQVFGVGLNKNSELGQNFTLFANESTVYDPIIIPALQDQGVKKVVAGHFSAAINMDNQVMIWGTGEFGTIRAPQKLFMDKVEYKDCKISKFLAVNEAGDDYQQPASSAYALDSNGQVYTWGSNERGQLGHGDTRTRKLPSQILSLKRKEIRHIDVGGDFAVMLGKDVKVQNSDPQLNITNMQESEPMPFNLDILRRLQEEGKNIQEAIGIRESSKDRSEHQRDDYPKFGQDHLNDFSRQGKYNSMTKNGNFKSSNPSSIPITVTNSCVKGDNMADESVFSSQNDYSILSNQKPEGMKSDHNKYVTTEPRSALVLPFQKGRKQDKKLRATTLPRNDNISEQMNRILSDEKIKDRERSKEMSHTSDRGNNHQQLMRDNSNIYHISSAPQSPIEQTRTTYKDKMEDMMNNTQQYMTTTDHDNRKTFPGETALKQKRQLARDIGVSLSEESNGEDSNAEDLYIHKLKSKHLKKQLKKLMSHSAQQICGLQLQLKQEVKKSEELMARVQDMENKAQEMKRQFKEELVKAQEKCSEINIEARKKEMKCEEKYQHLEAVENQSRAMVQDAHRQFENHVAELKNGHERVESKLRREQELMQQRITQYEKTLSDQTHLLNRYKGVDGEKQELLSRIQQLEQRSTTRENDYQALTKVNLELQRVMDNVEKDLNKQKKSMKKNEENYRTEKTKRKEMDKEREKANEKLRIERDHTVTLNQEIVQFKLQINQLEQQKQAILQDLDHHKQNAFNESDQLKNEIDILHKTMEEQKNSFEQQIMTLTQSKVSDISALNQQISSLNFSLDEAKRKNVELQSLLNDKSQHLEKVLRHVKNDCIEKSAILDDNERLDDIIVRLEKRNQELSQMLGDQVYNQAEQYKTKIFNKLTGNDKLEGLQQPRSNTDKKMPPPPAQPLHSGGVNTHQKLTSSMNKQLTQLDQNQFSQIREDLANTEKFEDKLVSVRGDNIQNPHMFVPNQMGQSSEPNAQQAVNVSNFNQDQVNSTLHNMMPQQVFQNQLENQMVDYRNHRNPQSFKTVSMDREDGSSGNPFVNGHLISLNPNTERLPADAAPSARGVEKVPTTSVSELSPPMISSNQNRSARFAQQQNQSQRNQVSHRGPAAGVQSSPFETNRLTKSNNSRGSSIQRSTRHNKSRSSSIKRVEQLQVQENEMRLGHLMRQELRQNAYDQMINKIYDNNQDSFIQNQSIRSLAQQSTFGQHPMSQGSYNQLRPQRSCNTTPQFEAGSHVSSSANTLVGGQQAPQYQTINYQNVNTNSSMERISPHRQLATQQKSANDQRRMKSLEVNGARRSGGQPRYKLHKNRNQLEESFNKIEYLLKQTNNLQEQTKQLRCSSSSHLQQIKNNRKNSNNRSPHNIGHHNGHQYNSFSNHGRSGTGSQNYHNGQPQYSHLHTIAHY